MIQRIFNHVEKIINTFVLALLIIIHLSTCTIATIDARNCTGVCEVYAAQIEIIYENSAPSADREKMKQIEVKARDAMRHGDWASVNQYVGQLRCAAGLGSSDYRKFWCDEEKEVQR